MNRLVRTRRMDMRRSSSVSAKVSTAQVGRMPVSLCSERSSSSSVNRSIPQSVWWMRMISRVPRNRCEMHSERIMSSVTVPPALRM